MTTRTPPPPMTDEQAAWIRKHVHGTYYADGHHTNSFWGDPGPQYRYQGTQCECQRPCPCTEGRCDVCRVAFAAADHPGSPAHPKRETSLKTGIPYYLGTKERPAFLPVWIVGYACRRLCRCWECNSRRMPSPMAPEQADQVMEEVHRTKLGRRSLQPNLAGQRHCLHLATPVCEGCIRGYHGGCTGWSWPRLHETWIRDSDGSDLFWANGSHYLVWTPPRECVCPCRTENTPAPAPPARPHRPATRSLEPARKCPAAVQEALFDLEV
ncbi:hypothetical protein AB0I72_19795 [Nocardiopsis sp. NPDC049922]|uniref:hypothetical protein n=1 Tax=Nocardiopsis sp. NPDC049922 TaxID=3155157 RepID=UPI0033D6FB13